MHCEQLSFFLDSLTFVAIVPRFKRVFINEMAHETTLVRNKGFLFTKFIYISCVLLLNYNSSSANYSMISISQKKEIMSSFFAQIKFPFLISRNEIPASRHKTFYHLFPRFSNNPVCAKYIYIVYV